MTRPALFVLRLSDGSTWTGSIHGAGGLLSGLDAGPRLLRAIERARVGKPFVDISEPVPGHANGPRTYAGPYELVDLRGAELLGFEAA